MVERKKIGYKNESMGREDKRVREREGVETVLNREVSIKCL